MKYFYQPEHIKRFENSRFSLFAMWKLWEHRYKTRRQLNALLHNDADRLHDDLGLSTEQVLEEIKKPFWR